MPEYLTRPDGWPLHAANFPANLTPVRASPYIYNGYSVGQPVPSNDHNGKLQNLGFWISYMDRATLRNSDWLDTTMATRVSSTELEYNVGDDITTLPGASPTSRAAYFIFGSRVELDDLTLQTLVSPAQYPTVGEPLYLPTATAPGRIWIYLRYPMSENFPTGIRIESVGPGVDDVPTSEEITVRGLEIDALGLISANIDSIAQAGAIGYKLPVEIPVVFDDATFNNITVTNDLTVTNVLTSVTQLDALGSAQIGTSVADLLEVLATSSFVADADFVGAVDIHGDTTIGDDAGDLLTVNATATFNESTDLLGDATLGTTGADTLTVNSTATLNAIANLLAGVNLADQEIEGVAGSVVDVETVEVAQLDFDNSGTSLPAAIRRAMYTNTFLAVRTPDNVVRPVPFVHRGYQAAFSTANAIEDTTCSFAIRLAETEPVDIEFLYEFRHSDKALQGLMDSRIEITGPAVVEVNLLSHQVDPYAVGPGWRSANIQFSWTPTDSFVGPGDFTYLVLLRLGTNLGADLEARGIRGRGVSAITV